MKGQYVPADDFKSLEKFADDYVRKTSVKKLNEMLRALGCELVIMPRAKAGRIDGAYIVTDEVGEK
jgi:hypothetical protein